MKIKHKNLITKENGKLLNCPENVFSLFKKVLDIEEELDKDKEHFWVAGLNKNNNIKYIELVHLGAVDRCTVGIKEILRTAIYYSCSNIVICHNHPAGSIKPSKNDLEVTRAIKEASRIVEINLLDSIIIGDAYFSFVENNML